MAPPLAARGPFVHPPENADDKSNENAWCINAVLNKCEAGIYHVETLPVPEGRFAFSPAFQGWVPGQKHPKSRQGRPNRDMALLRSSLTGLEDL
jgi:hypothetical protein